MTETDLQAAVRAYGAGRHYRAATLERWLALAAADAAALLDLALDCRLGENQLRDLWEWLSDIAARERLTLAAVLALDAVAAARRQPVGRNDRLRLVKSALRRLRYPQLSALEDRMTDLLRGLDLPRNVQLTLPDFLEGDAVHIEIVATDPDSLRAAAECLARAADSPACRELFALLGEAP
jgi:hypothetical protein